MNANFIPSLCAGALLLMCGAGATHFIGVQQQVKLHAALAKQTPAAQKSATESPASAAPNTTAPVVAAITQALAASQQPQSDPALKELTKDLLSELRKISRENQNLRDQVAETNRDLMEMQFRLDTHSQSFRPLRGQEATEPAAPLNSTPAGVLPPLEGGFSE